MEALTSSLSSLEEDANRKRTFHKNREEEEIAPTTSGTTKQNRETPRRLPGLHEKVEEYLHNLENEIQSKETESVK